MDLESSDCCSGYTQEPSYGIDLESSNCCSGYIQDHFYSIDLEYLNCWSRLHPRPVLCLESLNCCSGYTQDHFYLDLEFLNCCSGSKSFKKKYNSTMTVIGIKLLVFRMIIDALFI